jgi:type VI secretion system protein VasJ
MADEHNIAQQGGSQDALSPLLEAVRRPIPGDNPCGKDISYEEDFLAIKAEIDKMNTIGGQIDQERASELRQLMDATRGTVRKSERTEAEKLLEQRASVVKQGAGPDYLFIRQAGTRILSEKSKDIRIASYLCYALWQQNSFAGLAEGTAAIEILVRDFWDGLFPGKNRPAARKSALEFLTTKLDESVAYAQVREADRAPLERAKETLKSLQQQFLEKMPESPPSLLGLSQAVDKCLNKAPRPAAAPMAATTEASPSQSRPAGETGNAAVPTPGDLRTAQEATALVKQAAKFFREQNRKSATAYRLLRSIRWDPVLAPPPNEQGKTKIEAPPAQRRSFLTGLRENKNWPTLLDECENSLGQPGFHLWLDMQRFTAEALEGLGPEYSAARIAIISELTTLVQRVPKLPSLAFADGTPFADAATSAWIDESLLVLQASSGGSVQGALGPQSNGKLDAQVEEAKHAFESGDLAGAIAILASPQADTSRKSFFRRRLIMAGFCMKGGQPGIARPLLEELEQDIDRFSLQEWEPSLALEAWTALTRCYETLAAGPATPAKQAIQQRGERVFERICRLDTAYALASAGVKPASKRPAPAPSTDQGTPPANGDNNGTNANKEVITQPQS